MARALVEGDRLSLQGRADAARRGARNGGRRPQRAAPLDRRSVHCPHDQRRFHSCGYAARQRHADGRPASRRSGGYRHHHGETDRRFRRSCGDAGRRGDKARQAPLQVVRGLPGGKPAEDVCRDGQGYPRGAHQARGSSPQHAHSGSPQEGQAAAHRARDARNLCAACAPPRYLSGETRT